MNTDLLIIYIRNSRDIYALTEWLQNTLLKSDAWNIFLNSNNNYFSGAVMAPGYFLLSLFTL